MGKIETTTTINTGMMTRTTTEAVEGLDDLHEEMMMMMTMMMMTAMIMMTTAVDDHLEEIVMAITITVVHQSSNIVVEMPYVFTYTNSQIHYYCEKVNV